MPAMYRPTPTAALREIADVAARRRDCDCTDGANLSKIADLADLALSDPDLHVKYPGQGATWKALRLSYRIARASSAATDRMAAIGGIGTVDGRTYVTLIEDQPGDRPGQTVPVVAAKLMTSVENLLSIIAELQAAYDQWAALHNHRRKQN